jgi:small-conductance mechanosensitive channel
VLTYMRPYKLGDRVQFGEILGNVTEKNLLVTRIRTIKNEDITIPNSSILSGHTINYTDASQQERLLVYTTVSLGYEIPWQKVHELLISAAKKTKGVVDKEHFVLQKSLDDFYVSYEINAYVSDEIDFVFIYSELHQQIQDAFNEAGIEIMSPHYRAVRDGNNTTMPEQYVPKDFETPGFRIHDPKHDLK